MEGPEGAFEEPATTRLSTTEIRRLWADKAVKYGQSPYASWSDRSMIELEIRTIEQQLADGDHVLDVGCANGFSSATYAASRTVQILGVDAVPEMIEQAQARCAALPLEVRRRLAFRIDDVTELATVDDASFDKVISTRVIINLPTEEQQKRALAQCARVLRRGGTFLLSEATLRGLGRLNALRCEWGLDPIGMPNFNNYLDEGRLADAVRDTFEIVDVLDFSSSYYIATRVVKPLLARLLSSDEIVADPEMEFNRLASLLPPVGDYGTQRLFVLRRR